jgi:hypothetical protein
VEGEHGVFVELAAFFGEEENTELLRLLNKLYLGLK